MKKISRRKLFCRISTTKGRTSKLIHVIQRELPINSPLIFKCRISLKVFSDRQLISRNRSVAICSKFIRAALTRYKVAELWHRFCMVLVAGVYQQLDPVFQFWSSISIIKTFPAMIFTSSPLIYWTSTTVSTNLPFFVFA